MMTIIDCSLFDPAFPSLFLKLVDASGNNLIEVGTIDPNVIRVGGEFPNAGFIFIPVNEFAVQDADIIKLDDTIQLFIPTESHYQYSIQLSDSDSLLVDFSAKLTRIPCGLSYFLPTGVVVKNVEFAIYGIVTPSIFSGNKAINEYIYFKILMFGNILCDNTLRTLVIVTGNPRN